MNTKTHAAAAWARIAALMQEEEGATLVEYVLLVALIGVLAIIAMRFVGGTASNKLHNVGTTIS